MIEIIKKNAGIKGKFTEADLPKINLFKLGELEKNILNFLNDMPPYYHMYTGRDQSVSEKESILNPKFPFDK